MILNSRNPLPQPPKQPEIAYPCIWSYRVIGVDCSLLKDVIVAACSPLPVKISHSHTSSKGKYQSLNAELEVPSEEVRLKIYKVLQCSPAIKVIL
jgi:hypothetical protein